MRHVRPAIVTVVLLLVAALLAQAWSPWAALVYLAILVALLVAALVMVMPPPEHAPRTIELEADAPPAGTVGDEWSVDALERAALVYGRLHREVMAAPTPRLADLREAHDELATAARYHADAVDDDAAPRLELVAGAALAHLRPSADADADAAMWSCVVDGAGEFRIVDDVLEATCPACLTRELSYLTYESREVWSRLAALRAGEP